MNREVIQYMPTNRIEAGSQVREEFTERELLGLARSIQEVGVQQPIRVRMEGDRVVVVVGERRLRAARLAKLPEIPVIIEEKSLSEGEILQRQLVENLQRAELLPIERARGIRRLIDTTGWTLKDAAAKCGLSASMATKLLAILQLPVEIQQQVDAGAIPLSAGYELHRVGDAGTQASLARQVAERRLTRDALSDSVHESESNGVGRKQRSAGRITMVVAGGQSVTVSGRDLTLDQVVAALEELLTKTRRALRRGLDAKGLAASLRQANHS